MGKHRATGRTSEPPHLTPPHHSLLPPLRPTALHRSGPAGRDAGPCVLRGPVEEGTTRVRGRVVAHRRFGASPGPGVPVVVSCHGGLSCGADAALGHEAAAARISLLAVDRPAVGGWEDQPGRTTGDWAVNLAGVLDDLGVRRAHGVVGWSLGGQYALAARALLPDRIPSAAAVAGCLVDQPHVRRSLSVTDRALVGAVRPGVPRAAARAVFGRLASASARTMAAGRGQRRPASPDAPGGRPTLRSWPARTDRSCALGGRGDGLRGRDGRGVPGLAASVGHHARRRAGPGHDLAGGS